jgi:AraC family transcriptional regulator
LAADLNGLTPYKLRQVTQFINDNLARSLVLNDIAEAAGISVHRLAHLFKHSTGVAVHQYVVKARIEQAKRLLAETDLSVGEVARQVGYTHSRFSTLFLRHVGVTPTAYRNEPE